jgi:hypothetical protein
MGVMLLLLWKMALECMLNKNLFSCIHTQKQIHFLTTTSVRSWLAYPENANFPFVSDLLRSHRAHDKEHTLTGKPLHYVSDLLRSHRAQGKEHAQIEKSSNPKIKNTKLKYYLCINLKWHIQALYLWI